MDRSFRIDANQLQCPSKLLENLSEFLLQSARAMDTVENPRENHHSASASASRSTKTNPTASDRHRVTRENEDEIEDEQPSGLLARAHEIQKSMKNRRTATKFHTDTLLIAVCEMKETRPGLFARVKSPFMEVKAGKADGYEIFARKAARSCNLKRQHGKKICLFKLNGAMILDEPLKLKTKRKPWTIGGYLLITKKSANCTKLGVSYADYQQNESHSLVTASRQDEGYNSSYNSDIKVMYYIPPHLAARERLVREGLTRSYIWSCIKGNDATNIGIYQPENDGYKIFSIHKDDVPILQFENGAYAVQNSSSRLKILWQSPKRISICSTKASIPLYCVASTHNSCTYQWIRYGHKDTYPSTAVIYVNEAGLYQCKAIIGSQSIRGEMITLSVSSDSDPDLTPIAVSSPPPFKKLKYGSNNPRKAKMCYQKNGASKKGIIISDDDDQEFEKDEVTPRDINDASKYEEEQSHENSLVDLRNWDVFKHRTHEPSLWDAAKEGPEMSEVPSAEQSNEAPPAATHNYEADEVSASITTSEVPAAVLTSEVPSEVPAAVLTNEVPNEVPAAVLTTEVPSKVSSEVPAAVTANDEKLKEDNHGCNQVQVRRFSTNEIKEATGNFSPFSIIGKGGFGTVYQGYLKGTKVAIKKFTENAAIKYSNAENMTVPHKFTRDGQLDCELWALTRCRHKNLIDLMGYSPSPPILVYEFMEQGNLFDRLHKGKPTLTIHQRSAILKDVCRGLAWLHSMLPPVMHGDIKRNILLDHHLTAKLGDFGFTQEIPCIEGGKSLISAAIVAKSLGYSPPELDTAHVSCKSDMYCYGVVGLELFTGEPPFCREWEDQKLLNGRADKHNQEETFSKEISVDHYDDHRKSLQGYKDIYDKSAKEIPPYLLNIYYKIIENCLLRHSKRCTSSQVMIWWSETNF